jgi:hypothetical protein
MFGVEVAAPKSDGEARFAVLLEWPGFENSTSLKMLKNSAPELNGHILLELPSAGNRQIGFSERLTPQDVPGHIAIPQPHSGNETLLIVAGGFCGWN